MSPRKRSRPAGKPGGENAGTMAGAATEPPLANFLRSHKFLGSQTDSAPPHVQAVIERVSNSDRDFFDAHPSCDKRLRPARRHEFWPYVFSPGAMVIVHKLAEGVRAREVLG